MPFCSKCGYSAGEDMSFCPSCGAQLAAAAETAAYSYTQNTQYTDGGCYKVVLMSRGNCHMTNAIALLEDLFGYTAAQARDLLHTAPVELACNLSLTQAQYIAQALTEYGMGAAVYDAANNFIDLSAAATSSVFDARGNFLPMVAGALALLTAANRVRRITRWNHYGPRPPLFHLGFYRPAPPPHFRRSLGRRWGAPPPPARKPGRLGIHKAPPRPGRAPGGFGGGHRPADGRGPGGRGPGGRDPGRR